MALIRIHTRRPLPADLARLLATRPETWVDDQLSYFPDSVFGWDIGPAGSGHDMLYCTRLWRPGQLDRAWRENADRRIGGWIREMLPFGLRETGNLVAFTVYQFGGLKAFDSCGAVPFGTTAAQRHLGLCRHGVPNPPWMNEPGEQP